MELGTGPKGAQEHSGISPNVTPSYVNSPWWIHESQIDIDLAEKYNWFSIDTKDGKFINALDNRLNHFYIRRLQIIKKKLSI